MKSPETERMEREYAQREAQRIEHLKAMKPEERAGYFAEGYKTADAVFEVNVEREAGWWDGEKTVVDEIAPVVTVVPGDEYYTVTFQHRGEVEAFCIKLLAAADEAWPPRKR